MVCASNDVIGVNHHKLYCFLFYFSKMAIRNSKRLLLNKLSLTHEDLSIVAVAATGS